MKRDRYLFKMHRVISWIMVPLMIVVVVSGYAYTRNIKFLHRGLAFDLHTRLELPLLLLVVAHVVLAARFELRRFKIRSKVVDVILLISGIIVAAGLIYVDTRFP